MFRDKRIVDWMKATKELPSINILLFEFFPLNNIESKPRVIQFLDKPLRQNLS